uniref:Uncharacterized protein n=1 Tax=Anopheles funestus TaxID=62324 RepID=A0A182S141_ANOFN
MHFYEKKQISSVRSVNYARFVTIATKFDSTIAPFSSLSLSSSVSLEELKPSGLNHIFAALFFTCNLVLTSGSFRLRVGSIGFEVVASLSLVVALGTGSGSVCSISSAIALCIPSCIASSAATTNSLRACSYSLS